MPQPLQHLRQANKTLFHRTGLITVVTLAIASSGCSHRSAGHANSHLNSQMNSHPNSNTVVLLPDELGESSGLICLADGHFLSHNDSGHSSTLFKFDQRGRILQRYPIQAPNTDWEAITRSEQALWIADIGDNQGQRSQITLHRLPLPLPARVDARHAAQPVLPTQSVLTVQSSHWHYPNRPIKLVPYQHDYDAEALVYRHGELHLISKSWQSNIAKVYHANDAGELRLLAEIKDLPGLVTDAVYHDASQHYIMVGYRNLRQQVLSFMFSQDYQPFIALIDKNFQVIRHRSLPFAGQVEGVCIDQSEQIWLTQEQSQQQPAALWRYGALTVLQEADE